MKFIKTLVLSSLLFISQLTFSQNLQFYRENLSFEIKDGFFYVDGIYNFCNNGDKEIKQYLYYPFPLDSLYGKADSIKVLNVTGKSEDLISNKTDEGFLFNISISPYGVSKYNISYRQKLLKNKSEYILVTTKKWGKPFVSSEYRLITPTKIKITSTSYKPDSIRQIGDKRIYYWKKKDFMPDKNMVFYFEK